MTHAEEEEEVAAGAGSVTNPHGWEQLLGRCLGFLKHFWLQTGHLQMRPSTRKRMGQGLGGRRLGDTEVNG